MLTFSAQDQSLILHIKMRTEPWDRKWLSQNHTAKLELTPRYPDLLREEDTVSPTLSLQTHAHKYSKEVRFRAETTDEKDSKTVLILNPQILHGNINYIHPFKDSLME